MTIASQAFVGKAYVSVGDGASPEVFTRYCEVDSISEFGAKNSLVDVTTFCSNGNMEYIGGLADGKEVTFGANYSLSNVQQDQLIDDTEHKRTRNIQIQMGDDSPVAKIYHMALAMLEWGITASVNKQNAIKFIGKITGQIVTEVS